MISLRTLLKRSILHECKTQILYRGNNHFFYNVTLTHVDVEKSKIPRILLLRATVAMVTETKNRKWQSFKLVILIDMKKITAIISCQL